VRYGYSFSLSAGSPCSAGFFLAWVSRLEWLKLAGSRQKMKIQKTVPRQRMDEAKQKQRNVKELIEAARTGERSALDQLLQREQSRVYRFGMKMCGNSEDAEDVLQETLLSMVRNIGDFKGSSSLSTWLYTIARSFCIKKRRRGKFAPDREESLDGDTNKEIRQIFDPASSPEKQVESIQIRDALDHAIATLEPKYREVLVLRDLEGLSAPEVSQVLGLGIDAIKSRLHRARSMVRQQLAPLLLEENTITPDGEKPSCPDVVELLSRHLEGELDQRICEEMERHIAICKPCRTRCDSLHKTLQLCATSPTPQIPRQVQHSVRQAIERYLGVAQK